MQYVIVELVLFLVGGTPQGVTSPLHCALPIIFVTTQDEPLVSASADGRTCAYAKEETLICYDFAKRKELWRSRRENLITTLCFSPSGDLLAVSGYGWTIELHESSTGKLLKTLKGPKIHPVTCLAFSPNGKHLLSGSSVAHSNGKDAVNIWSVEKGEHTRTIEGHGLLRIGSLAFTKAGNHVIIGSNLKDILVVEAESGKVVRTVAFGSSVSGLALSSDGKYVAAISDELSLEFAKKSDAFSISKDGYSSLQLWEVNTWSRVEAPKTSARIVAVRFSHKDKRVAYSDGDYIAEYDLNRRERVFNCSFPAGWITAMDSHTSANGILIVSRPKGIFFLDCASHEFKEFKVEK